MQLPETAPGLQQLAANHRVLQPRRAIQIPGIAGAPGATTWFMIGQISTGARIIGLLGFPGHQAALDVDFPATGTGAVHPMGRAHDLVMRPAPTIGALPVAWFTGGYPVSIGKAFRLFPGEIGQVVKKVTHSMLRDSGIVELCVFTQIEPPVDQDADTVKNGKTNQCIFRCRRLDLFAEYFRYIECTVRCDG